MKSNFILPCCLYKFNSVIHELLTFLEVHESVHRDTTIKITHKMHYIDQFIIPSRLYMFRATFAPIIRNNWLYLQYLVVFTQVAAGWCSEWVETELCRLWGVYTRLTIHIQSSALNDGRKHRPKHVELTWNNKLIYRVHLVGYFHSYIYVVFWLQK